MEHPVSNPTIPTLIRSGLYGFLAFLANTMLSGIEIHPGFQFCYSRLTGLTRYFAIDFQNAPGLPADLSRKLTQFPSISIVAENDSALNTIISTSPGFIPHPPEHLQTSLQGMHRFIGLSDGPNQSSRVRVLHDGPKFLRVTERHEVTDWIGAAAESFPLFTHDESDVFLQELWDTQKLHLFFLRVKNQVVANAAVFIHQDTAGVFWVSTHSTLRRRGYAKLLMEGIIDWCAEQGYHDMVLHASESATRLYQSLGFQAYQNFYITSLTSSTRRNDEFEAPRA